MPFDTLMYAKKLKQVGFTEAEVQAEAMADFTQEKLATKHDLKKLETEIKRDMRELEMRLTFKLASIIVIVVGLFTGLLGMFLKFTH